MSDVMPGLSIYFLSVCVCVFVHVVYLSEVMPGWLSIFVCYSALG